MCGSHNTWGCSSPSDNELRMVVELGRDKLTGAVDSHHQIRQGLALWSNTDTFKLDVSTHSGTPCVHIFVNVYSWWQIVGGWADLRLSLRPWYMEKEDSSFWKTRNMLGLGQGLGRGAALASEKQTHPLKGLWLSVLRPLCAPSAALLNYAVLPLCSIAWLASCWLCPSYDTFLLTLPFFL